MKITWLGQGGFLFDNDGFTVMVDPYLSNSLYESAGEMYKRLVPIDEKCFEINPDVLILTHAHGDHADEETLKRLLSSSKRIDVLCPSGVYEKLKERYVLKHNLILFDRGCEWTTKRTTFRAVKAVHSDISPIGVIFEIENKCIYITGDTLYNKEIFTDIEKPVDLLFVCINGVGNNMNIADAVRFTKEIRPKVTIPMHWGMFERFSSNPDSFIETLKDINMMSFKMKYCKATNIEEIIRGSKLENN